MLQNSRKLTKTAGKDKKFKITEKRIVTYNPKLAKKQIYEILNYLNINYYNLPSITWYLMFSASTALIKLFVILPTDNTITLSPFLAADAVAGAAAN